MSYLSSASISNLVDAYKTAQTSKRVTPLTTKKTKYENLNTAFSTLTTKLTALKGTLATLKLTGASSAFATKSAESSNSDLMTAVATNAAGTSSYTLRTTQLAKSDIAISTDLASDTVTGITTGTHSFLVKTSDGEGGEFASNVQVDLDAADTYAETMEKIREAISVDKAVINSDTVSGNYAGAEGKFTVTVDDEDYEITYGTGDTYENIISSVAEQISDISGVSAEKVVDGTNFRLKIIVTDATKAITIKSDTDTGELLDAGNLNINIEKEKGASGTVSASVFAPSTNKSQFSLTAKSSGLDYRIKEISDVSGSSALSSIGFNLGTSRADFVQAEGADTAGFVYSDITETGNKLNAMFTFNGLSMQRNSNSVDDLVTGVTFNLKSVMSVDEDDVSITIENNIEDSKSKIQSFITNFNDIYSYLKSESKNTGKTRGLFVGDANASALKSMFGSYSYKEIPGLAADDIKTLSQIGITFDVDTGFSITDNSLLEDKLTNNIGEVESLFNSENGIANTLFNSIKPYLGSGGYLALSQSSNSSSVTYLSKRITSINSNIDKNAESLRLKYQKMLAQLAELESSSSMLSTLSGY